MSTLAHARARSVASVADAVVAFVRDWAEAAEKRTAYRRTVAQLSSLSDRELDDLGVSRWQIDAVAERAVYGA